MNAKSPTLAELVPLVDAIAGYGPPVALAGPWVFLALILAGPFACLVILVAFMVLAGAALLALAAAILAGPYLLVRRHRVHRAVHVPHGARLVPVNSRRVVA